MDDDPEFVGGKLRVRKTDLTRLIASALDSLGFRVTMNHLQAESGVRLYASEVHSLCNKIHSGDWDGSLQMLRQLVGESFDDSKIRLASELILEHKFYELTTEGVNRNTDALRCLQEEIRPITSLARMKQIGMNLIRRKPPPESREKLLEKLLVVLRPLVITECRLLNLIEDGLSLQASRCKFHNSSIGDLLLFPDHQCTGTQDIPSETVQILLGHKSEVGCVKFSNKGTKLASSSCDGVIIIWEVRATNQVDMKHTIYEHEGCPVFCVAWSPDDEQLLSCGWHDVVRRWDVESGICLCEYEQQNIVSCAWSEDGQNIITGASDRSVRMSNLNGEELSSWAEKTSNSSNLGIAGQNIVTICSPNTIVVFESELGYENKIEPGTTILSFCVSRNKQLLLLCLAEKTLELYKIGGRCAILAGLYKTKGDVTCCLGGEGDAFIATANSDKQVYIWNRFSGELISILSGHSDSVNCVSWNPARPDMLASGSDDKTIRIWGLKENRGQNSI